MRHKYWQGLIHHEWLSSAKSGQSLCRQKPADNHVINIYLPSDEHRYPTMESLPKIFGARTKGYNKRHITRQANHR
jgi:hypothetical protein